MSKLSDQVEELLRICFPFYRIRKEFYVEYAGHKLRFDFLVEELRILVEVQGRQHYEYVPHFHRDSYYFFTQKVRDRAKVDWASSNDYFLLTFDEGEELSKAALVRKIKEAS